MQQAIAVQPDFARAHVGLADVWLIMTETGDLLMFPNRNSPDWDRIDRELAEANRLDPDSAECQATLGNLANVRWRFVEAETHFRRALELNPNYATGHQWYARFLALQGRMDEALQQIDAAMLADPFAPRIISNGAMLYVMAGRAQRGLELADRALALQKDSGQPWVWKIEALLALGRNEAATATVKEFMAAAPASARGSQSSYVAQASFHDGTPRPSQFQRRGAREFRYDEVRDALLSGRPQDALALVDADHMSYAEWEWMHYLPLFDAIRNEPRYQQMLARLGLTEAHARAQAWRAANPPTKEVAK